MDLNKSYFFVPLMLFTLIAIYYLVTLFPMTSIFTFENDLGSHIARLQFFEEHGYSGPAPEWYQGYKPFELYPSGAFFFFAIVNLILKDSLAVWYIGLVLILLFGLLLFLWFGRIIKITALKAVAFFLFFFLNPLMILNIVRLGRYPEVFSWLVFVLFCCGIYYLKDRQINWWFIPFICVYAFLMISYLYLFVIAFLLTAGLFLIKNNKERLLIALGLGGAASSTFFWWKSFLFFGREKIFTHSASLELPSLSSIISFNTIIMIMFFVLIYFYISSVKSKRREIIFYLPVLVIACILVLRLIIFVPIFNNLPTNIYSLFFLFLSILFLLKADFKKWNKFIGSGLTLLSVATVIFLLLNVRPHLNYSDKDKEYIKLLSKVDGVFLFLAPSDEVYAEKMLAYGSVFYDIHTPSGFYPYTLELKPTLKDKLDYVNAAYKNRSCGGLNTSLDALHINEFFVESDGCSFIRVCEFEIKESFNIGCLAKNMQISNTSEKLLNNK